MLIQERLSQYACLMRLGNPTGTFLLLWPTLWALWLASCGRPDGRILLIFVMGVFLMRSAGCVINDFADRHIDGHVERTRTRPIVSGQVSVFEALSLAGLLLAGAFFLVLQCNLLTIYLSFIGAALTCIYPFLKRYTYLPQCGLGVAFAWGVPMAFVAQTGAINTFGWFLFLTGVIWSVIYDTMYAMADREDDLKIGVKSTAILFGVMDRLIIGLLQVLFIIMLVIVGIMFELNFVYYASVVIVAILSAYQQWLVKDWDAEHCLKAFSNHNHVGMVVFTGIFLSYLQ